MKNNPLTERKTYSSKLDNQVIATLQTKNITQYETVTMNMGPGWPYYITAFSPPPLSLYL